MGSGGACLARFAVAVVVVVVVAVVVVVKVHVAVVVVVVAVVVVVVKVHVAGAAGAVVLAVRHCGVGCTGKQPKKRQCECLEIKDWEENAQARGSKG